MKLIFVTILVLVFAASTDAQEVPLPAALMTAKTAIVVNAGMTQDYYERFILELRDLQRFTLVDDPSRADVTIHIESQNMIGVNPVTRTTVPGVGYWLSITRGDIVLYRDQLKGCCSFKAMTRKTLDKLDKRLREQARLVPER